MFDKFKEQLEGFFINKKEEWVIPFEDPIAQQTNWKPLEKGGSNFRTHELKIIGYNRLEVAATLQSKLFIALFVIAGFGMMGYYFYTIYFKGPISSEDNLWILILVGVGFSVGGLFGLVKAFTKKIFDKQTGYYWKGTKGPRQTYGFQQSDRFIPLSTIHALQIIKEKVRTKNSSFTSYELNLVLKDLRRMNVMDHSKLEKLREDAEALSKFLNVPIWDAVQ